MKRQDVEKVTPFVFCILFLLVFWALVSTLIYFALTGNEEELKREGKNVSSYSGRGNRQRGKLMWVNSTEDVLQETVDYSGVYWWQTDELLVRSAPEEINPNLKTILTCLLSLMLTVCVTGNSLTLLALSYVRLTFTKFL